MRAHALVYLRILASFLLRSGTLGLSYGCVVCLMYARCRRHRLSPTRLCVVCCMCICALSARHRPRDTRLCWVACVCALSARHMIVLCDSLLLCGDFNLRCQCIAGMFDSFPFRRILALGGCPLFRRGHAEFFRGSTSILSNYSLALCIVPRRRPWSGSDAV